MCSRTNHQCWRARCDWAAVSGGLSGGGGARRVEPEPEPEPELLDPKRKDLFDCIRRREVREGLDGWGVEFGGALGVVLTAVGSKVGPLVRAVLEVES